MITKWEYGHYKEKYLIDCNIESYNDSILLNAFSMDACHILLGGHGILTEELCMMRGEIPTNLRRIG